ncbi:bifunctional dethiobiotin synthetase/adenosylmethionine-8-amino-7-oxononanoate aminotransferase [Triangularia verruculosa]|uniref:Bifunctional dethiobiotin synthetase/adenosylmethionine-8-amino-7-oxononanoate aminotransferase n=1 Tax=Triangularia verruculosa TaxID=2587418 RepID=A0AAN6XDL7_9PEZI|nr:bifunctional dethiobiotin synthetase/adenosylmethionine-8-amino-7-oxononanoate aminotransferase [Triangularia verruculosa]
MTVPPQLGALLHRSLRVYQVWGANTEVGKTVFSTILCGLTSTSRPDEKTAFLKPVSTGPTQEADDCHISKYLPGIRSETLYQFDLPVSPHLAAQVSQKNTPSDKEVLAGIHGFASRHASPNNFGWLFIETAGGVHSPGPSGTTQADLYRPLRVPAVLIGDSKLGGISQTISAFESLKLRGYDVELVMLFENDTYQNHSYLRRYFQENHSIPVQTAPLPPLFSSSNDTRNMRTYYTSTLALPSLSSSIPSHLSDSHQARISRLESMPDAAAKTIWYPFTQHTHLPSDKITVIDSAKDSHFDTFDHPSPANKSVLRPMFDGSASWWTQGLGHGSPTLALAAAYAAGRYGHVMFAETIHEPALALAETLLEGMGNERLKRVFYSDNGSTGVEVAVKMALGAARGRYGWTEEERKKVGVVGLKGSYHGDTIGAMDCSEPGVYNERVEWYEGRGAWLGSPGVRCEKGVWVVDGLERRFGTLGEVFDVEGRERRGEGGRYEREIRATLEGLVRKGGRFGALILEPVVLGAGGMHLVDPLFQRTLVNVVRSSPELFGHAQQSKDKLDWSGLPVVFDEVFTGIYRLGRFSAASFLGVDPDISVHAKLLTGGLLPLSVTLASESVFQSFLSEDKSDALLHGHSYTAHAVGCQVALESVKEMAKMEKDGRWSWAQNKQQKSDVGSQPDQVVESRVWSVWSHEFVEWLSWQSERGVEGVWALGTVLAIHMGGEAGYKSTAAKGLQAALLRGSEGDGGVHSRVLGNVLYLMAGQTTTEETVRRVEPALRGFGLIAEGEDKLKQDEKEVHVPEEDVDDRARHVTERPPVIVPERLGGADKIHDNNCCQPV